MENARGQQIVQMEAPRKHTASGTQLGSTSEEEGGPRTNAQSFYFVSHPRTVATCSVGPLLHLPFSGGTTGGRRRSKIPRQHTPEGSRKLEEPSRDGSRRRGWGGQPGEQPRPTKKRKGREWRTQWRWWHHQSDGERCVLFVCVGIIHNHHERTRWQTDAHLHRGFHPAKPQHPHAPGRHPLVR